MPPTFKILGEIRNVETIASGRGVYIRHYLERTYGRGRWRKMKGMATVEPNSPPNSGKSDETARLGRFPDHQEGIRCKAPRSEEGGVSCHTPHRRANEGNAADDALMVIRGGTPGWHNM